MSNIALQTQKVILGTTPTASPSPSPQAPATAENAGKAATRPADALTLSSGAKTASAPLFNLAGLKQGDTRPIEGSFSIFNFGGKGEVTKYDDKTLEVVLHAKALFVKQTIKVRFDKQDDGSIKFVSKTVGGGDSNNGTDSAQTLKIVSQAPNKIVMKDEQGQTLSLGVDGKGKVTVKLPNGDSVSMLPK